LIVAVEFSNGAGGGYAEYGFRVAGSVAGTIAEQYTDASAGYWFASIPLVGKFTSSGETVAFSAAANAASRAVGNRSRYLIIDLGCA
jgi:hypothetical protein